MQHATNMPTRKTKGKLYIYTGARRSRIALWGILYEI